MDNIWTIVIIGVYTLIYVIVFFIQKAQMEKYKETISAMKSFMDIFKIDEVKKYVDLKDESSLMRAQKMIFDNTEIKQAMRDITEAKTHEIKELYLKEFSLQYDELARFSLEILSKMETNERNKFIEINLSKSKHILLPLLEKYDENKNRENQ